MRFFQPTTQLDHDTIHFRVTLQRKSVAYENLLRRTTNFRLTVSCLLLDPCFLNDRQLKLAECTYVRLQKVPDCWRTQEITSDSLQGPQSRENEWKVALGITRNQQLWDTDCTSFPQHLALEEPCLKPRALRKKKRLTGCFFLHLEVDSNGTLERLAAAAVKGAHPPSGLLFMSASIKGNMRGRHQRALHRNGGLAEKLRSTCLFVMKGNTSDTFSDGGGESVFQICATRLATDFHVISS